MPHVRVKRTLFQMALITVPVVAATLGMLITPTPDSANAEPMPLTTAAITPAVPPVRTERAVNPSVEHIGSWISSVGAGAAVADLDGDTLANDVCLVDPRSDSVGLHHVDRGTKRATLQHTILQAGRVTTRAGLVPPPVDPQTEAPMGCRLADIDGDGRTDVLVYFWGRGPIALFNQGGWEFEAHEVVPGGAGLDWYTNTATFADLNGDGVLDLFLGNYFADGSELLDRASTATVAMNDSLSRASNGGRNYVLLGQRGSSGRSYDLRADVFPDEQSRGWTLAVAAADFNGDSLPELYVANDFGPDRFFVNRSTGGELVFENVDGGLKGWANPRSTMIGRDSFKGMGVTASDVDGDGLLDLYVSNITQDYGLFESQLLFLGTGVDDMGVPTFRPGAEELGLARTAFSWDNKVGDLNNDGHRELLQATGFIRGSTNRWPEVQELALANDTLISDPAVWPDLTDADVSGAAPRVVMTRTPNGQYTNVAEKSGLTDGGVMRGIALADVDGDGDLDWVEANQWADSRLVENDCAPCGEFVGLRVLREQDGQAVGTRPDRRQVRVLDGTQAAHDVGGTAAVGAVLTVRSANGVTHHTYVDGGNGHSGQSSADVHLGLGADHVGPVDVKLTWRDHDGVVQRTDVNVETGWHTIVLPS